MKFNIQNCVRVVTPFISSFVLILCMVVSVDAAVLDPFAMGSITVDGDNEIVHVDFPSTDIFWRSYQDNVLTKTGFGETFQITLQEKAIDNNYTETLLFGNNNYFPTSGVTADSMINADLLWGVSAPGVSQTFQLLYKLNLRTFDENMNTIAVHVIEENQFDYPTSLGSIMDIPWNVSFSGGLLKGAAYYNLYVTWDFASINDESVTTSISLSMQSALSLDIPYSQLWMLREQGAQTNKLLNEIDKQMQANGEKLDQIMNGNQADQDAANDFENNSSNQGGQLDDANDALNDVTKPDPDDIPMDVGNYIPPDGSRAFSDLLAPVYASPVMYTPLLIAVVFLVLRFVLFGKAR